LVEDQAVLTALANDVGFELVFSRQLIAHADELDMAIGFSTSGDSPNMLCAFEEAARRALLTVGLCGYEGSGMAVSEAVHHCLVVHSESVHRIQEVQDALTLALWESVQRHLPLSADATATGRRS
jgi:D-sedoheptulose 7-phosphate isomerase